MIIATTPSVPGREITETLGMVKGSTIRARHLGRDLLAAIRGFVGGEVMEYSKLMGESREQALDRMKAEGLALGADAIIAVRFSTSQVMDNAAEILIYGTAVKLRSEE